MKAIVLAAGYATRLYPLTLRRPKALLEIGGRPLLDRVLERVLALGDVDESIVVTAWFAPQFEEWAVDKHRVTIVNDGVDGGRPTRRDRRHRLRTGLLGIDDDVVVVAEDNLFAADISGFGAAARAARPARRP